MFIWFNSGRISKCFSNYLRQRGKRQKARETTDRGKEFSCYASVENNFDTKLYFADPYCALQREINENSNGLLREFYPKKTDLAAVDEHEFNKNLGLINNRRPRKCLSESVNRLV